MRRMLIVMVALALAGCTFSEETRLRGSTTPGMPADDFYAVDAGKGQVLRVDVKDGLSAAKTFWEPVRAWELSLAERALFPAAGAQRVPPGGLSRHSRRPRHRAPDGRCRSARDGRQSSSSRPPRPRASRRPRSCRAMSLRRRRRTLALSASIRPGPARPPTMRLRAPAASCGTGATASFGRSARTRL